MRAVGCGPRRPLTPSSETAGVWGLALYAGGGGLGLRLSSAALSFMMLELELKRRRRVTLRR